MNEEREIFTVDGLKSFLRAVNFMLASVLSVESSKEVAMVVPQACEAWHCHCQVFALDCHVNAALQFHPPVSSAVKSSFNPFFPSFLP